MRVGALLAGVLFFVQASVTQASESETPFDFSEMARRFVVKVVSETASIFSADRSGGHGTGFIVDIREGEKGPVAVVFTNRHVIESSNFDVQRLTVEIATESNIHERAKARLVYESPLEDFAIIEFDLADAGPAADDLQPIPLPEPDSPAYQFSDNHRPLQGREVLAIGNPFSSSDITTFGQINGRYVNDIGQTYIQTQTPINPGNSGGPLFSIDDGVVIGMNTAGIDGASNVGYAIPVGDLLEEYRIWREQTHLTQDRRILIQIAPVSEDLVKIEGTHRLIDKRYPGFFKRHTGVTLVRGAAISTGIEPGDYLIAINGQTFGDHYFKFLKTIQFSESATAKVVVLRNGEFISIDLPILDHGLARLRERHDFVMISGAIFTEITPYEAFLTAPNDTKPSQVELTQILDTSEINFGAFEFPSAGSLVTGVTINNRFYSVRRLVDLKTALHANPRASSMKLRLSETLPYKKSNGEVDVIRQLSGAAIHHPMPSTVIVPITEIVTPRKLSLRDFRKSFSFEPQDFKSRDWRRAMQVQARIRQERRRSMSSAPCEAQMAAAASAK